MTVHWMWGEWLRRSIYINTKSLNKRTRTEELNYRRQEMLVVGWEKRWGGGAGLAETDVQQQGWP